jgi:hypothetical protein
MAPAARAQFNDPQPQLKQQIGISLVRHLAMPAIERE